MLSLAGFKLCLLAIFCSGTDALPEQLGFVALFGEELIHEFLLVVEIRLFDAIDYTFAIIDQQ
jgi:hypothetical protein